MPRYDGTGPSGQGPMTGRGMGPCGCGVGYGMGYNRGYGRRFYNRKEESEILKEEADNLKKELKAIEERMSELNDSK